MDSRQQRYFHISRERGRADKASELLWKADDLTPRPRTRIKVAGAEGDKLIWVEELPAQNRLRSVLQLLEIPFKEVSTIEDKFK
jgi:hypothetical protein